ncbi:MAG: flagellar biosynthesis anti-sigma factor FlgM [Armatimonadetes bacterium]|nr:MAG: flagellar biosynthesis anti-sigma factor FlgM [Armatimonadota bacterium]GIV02259.1 MAG: hypothetical protein KatS3mg015_1089 [Fimbriimonadales bacterium]
MKVSQEQIKAILKERKAGGFSKNVATGGALTERDVQLLGELRERIKQMPEIREELVLQVKEQIARGEYNPSAEEIADAMIRRTLADKSAQ